MSHWSRLRPLYMIAAFVVIIGLLGLTAALATRPASGIVTTASDSEPPPVEPAALRIFAIHTATAELPSNYGGIDPVTVVAEVECRGGFLGPDGFIVAEPDCADAERGLIAANAKYNQMVGKRQEELAYQQPYATPYETKTGEIVYPDVYLNDIYPSYGITGQPIEETVRTFVIQQSRSVAGSIVHDRTEVELRHLPVTPSDVLVLKADRLPTVAPGLKLASGIHSKMPVDVVEYQSIEQIRQQAAGGIDNRSLLEGYDHGTTPGSWHGLLGSLTSHRGDSVYLLDARPGARGIVVDDQHNLVGVTFMDDNGQVMVTAPDTLRNALTDAGYSSGNSVAPAGNVTDLKSADSATREQLDRIESGVDQINNRNEWLLILSIIFALTGGFIIGVISCRLVEAKATRLWERYLRSRQQRQDRDR